MHRPGAVHPLSLDVSDPFRSAIRMKHTTTTSEQQAFLESVSELNEKYNAVRTNSGVVSLGHCFWTKSMIEGANQLQAEWNVAPTMIPFYGDWHDLICLNTQSGSIEMIDDNRRLLFAWPSHTVFLNSLEMTIELPSDPSSIIESESWIEF
jgi:hypothetical protein